MTQVPLEHLRLGRVLHEDDTFVTLEVCKDDNRKVKLEDQDKFFTMIFVHHNNEEGVMETWLPWKGE